MISLAFTAVSPMVGSSFIFACVMVKKLRQKMKLAYATATATERDASKGRLGLGFRTGEGRSTGEECGLGPSLKSISCESVGGTTRRASCVRGRCDGEKGLGPSPLRIDRCCDEKDRSEWESARPVVCTGSVFSDENPA